MMNIGLIFEAAAYVIWLTAAVFMIVVMVMDHSARRTAIKRRLDAMAEREDA